MQSQARQQNQSQSHVVQANNYPSLAPRFWHGMRTLCWWRLLARNGFRITPSRWHVALGVSIFTPLNDLLAATQWLLYNGQIERTEIKHPPIFILGHWRTGTTLLHELLTTDPKFASPNTFQCFAPSHFLLSEYLMVRFGNFLIPKKRPMDDMEAGWKLPQEDEFALMNLGVPTPYLRIAFPRTQPQALEYLDMQGLSPEAEAHWKKSLLWFMRALTLHYHGQRLVLKSPPHTGRVKQLLELFPDAKFIHLTRDPRKLFTSTMKLWRSLDEVQGLQRTPDEPELKEYVTECMRRMYSGFEQACGDLPDNQFVHIQYEDLVANPMATVSQLFEQLELGDFSQVRPELEKRLVDHTTYRPNRHEIDAELELEILARWPEYAAKYSHPQ